MSESLFFLLALLGLFAFAAYLVWDATKSQQEIEEELARYAAQRLREKDEECDD